ncbi:T9SS type B sorting domain-containing protein [Flavobacterium terrisoli]|uniref:T9SS type B sorting domain-containing protein n=1 Tax=Flavobacterium terrisoli TaxID=3242195 RepID=UPI002542D159|nr:T9SS type B sorting domain-containing protein [Flavobacterium buctense]
MKKWCYRLILVLLWLCPMAGFSFSFSVAVTHETCPGNGSVTMTVSGADPGGSITYFVYKLPELVTPFASGPSNIVNGLTAGTYRIIARETVGSTVTTQQQDITITSSFEPLVYTVETTYPPCSSTSIVTAVVTEGNPVSYAIISGPATYPPQASNTFSGLAPGVYRMSVTDSCGNALVQAFTVPLTPPPLTAGGPVFSDTAPPSCNFLVATNTILAGTGTVIAYPLQVLYTLYLPGNTTTVNMVLNSGNPTSQEISLTIPYDVDNDYIYSITLTDACGITYPPNNFIVNNDIFASAEVIPLPCNKHYVNFAIQNFVGTFSMQFTSAPAGFDPVTFDSNYPGPYTQSTLVYGSEANPMPIGDYVVTITDPCGKTFDLEFTVEDTPPIVSATGSSNGCLSNDGQISISVSNTELATVIVMSAPAGYPFPLPHDVTASINSAGALSLAPVPQGDYILYATDICGNVYDPLPVNVPPYENMGITIDVLPGCARGFASLKIIGNNGRLLTAKITAAPAAYPFPLPHDISNNILATGELYLSDLPEGNYTFTTTDICNFTSNKSQMINGYTVNSSSYSLVADCGVFNIPLQFNSNLTGSETFVLQKLLDEATDTWGHPITDVVYPNGTIPNTANSYILVNNAINPDLTFTGVFRIVHLFTSYNNGVDINGGLVTFEKKCVEILSPYLTYTDVLSIDEVYRIPCSTSGNFDVLVTTTGQPPLHYWIIEKDGAPFVIDNGNSNVFLNLTTGIYKFKVEDACGNSITRSFDLSDLEELVTVFPACDMLYCTPTITGNETFDLSSQNAGILGPQSTADYTLSYHTSQADANSNSNPITNITAFNPVSSTQTIYIRLIFNQLPNCYQTGSFDLITGQNPRINLLSDYVSCAGQPVVLNAANGNLPITTYAWSDGTTLPSITIGDVGTTTVNVTATNTYGNCNTTPLSCVTTKDITVNIAEVPEIDHIESHDWTDDENSITVVTTTQGVFEYSIDGITFQDSPSFTNLRPGLYTVYVRDPGGCRLVTQIIWLLNYPHYFTPNGDGVHETWYIKNSENEPHFQVYIFDRYGKLITGFPSGTEGWDGTLNGKMLFSDDYWFVVHREDGRTHKGHFTLKR